MAETQVPGTDEEGAADTQLVETPAPDAALEQGGSQVQNPNEAGFGNLSEVIAHAQKTHDAVAGTIHGIGDFPEVPEGHLDRED